MTKQTEFKSILKPIIAKLNYCENYLSDPGAYTAKELEPIIIDARSLVYKLKRIFDDNTVDPRELLETVKIAKEKLNEFEEYFKQADNELNRQNSESDKLAVKYMKLDDELQQLHTEWKQTINDSNINITQLKNQINVVNLKTSDLLKETETNYRARLQETETNYQTHLKEVEKQYKEYCFKIKNENNDYIFKIKNDQNNYILSIKDNSNKEIQNIRNEIVGWETKLRESRSKWKTLKTQIETMKKNKEQI